MAFRSWRFCIAELAAAAVLAGGLATAAADTVERSTPARESTIPFKRSEDALSAGTFWRVALGFSVALGVGVGGIYLLRRVLPRSLGQAMGNSGRIRVLEVRRLAPKLTLFLVEVDGRAVLLSQSGEHVQQLELRGGGSVVGGEHAA